MEINPEFTTKQKDCLRFLFDDSTNEVLFGGAAGGGKSWVGSAWLIILCLRYPKTRHLMGRSKLDALKKTTLSTFFEVCGAWGLKSGEHYTFNGSSNIVSFTNGSEIILKDLFLYPSDRNFDSLGSLSLTSAFIDEANQVTYKAINVVQSRLRHKLDEFGLVPKLLMTCNPAKNWVYTEYYKPAQLGTLKDYRKFVPSLVTDNQFISKHYEKQLSKLDEVSKQRLLFGNWEYDASSDSLINYDSILNLFSNTGTAGEKYISCDVARMGEDKSVVMLFEGLQVVMIKTFDKNTITELAEYIRDLQKNHQVKLSNIIVDSDGVGGGLQDVLRCKGFINNASPVKKENFQNLKTQCYYKLADLINKGQIGITIKDVDKRKMITEELEQVRSKDIDKDGKLKIVPKDVVKSVIGRSPDYSDALAMRMFYEVKPSSGRYAIR